MAEETKVEQTTEQESPTVEQEQPEIEEADAGENLEQTPAEDVEGEQQQVEKEDKNWRAMRERLEALENENKQLKGVQKPRLESVGESDVHRPFLGPSDMAQLDLKIFKAQQLIPELDPTSEKYDRMLDVAVAGEYRAALDEYTQGLLQGKARSLPDPVTISKSVKSEWDKRFEATTTKVKDEIVKQKEKAVQQKQATTDAEGSSGRRPQAQPDMDQLRYRSRQGDDQAVAERLKRSGL